MINPAILKRLRESKGWTQLELQQHSNVDKQTISRLERGEPRRPRDHTVASLCKALAVEPAVLAGKAAIELGDRDHRSALTVRIDDGPRNALTLSSTRYKVRPEAIVELAPFLFTWAAEMSLRRRAERLDALERQWAQAEAMKSEFSHLHWRLTSDDHASDIAAAERKSIETRDLFASGIAEEDFRPILADDFEAWEGPLVCFLRDLAKQIEPQAEFESWHPLGGPAYEICQEEAAALVDGDTELASSILGGAVQLHKLPAELRKPRDTAARSARIDWIREEAQAACA